MGAVRRVPRRFAALVAIAAAVLITSTTTTPASADGPHRPLVPHSYTVAGGATVHYAVNRPLCPTPSNRHTLRCFAIARTNVRKGTPHAYEYTLAPGFLWGPSGGYTPDLLASIYGYDADASTKGQLVAVIDWYADPAVRTELNTFDQQYKLPVETATSFRVVNQAGKASPLPKADTSTAGEIALDVQAVRGVCHTCRILLVEANGPTAADAAAAVNTAVRLGATEISNSYGVPEAATSSKVLAAYNHPGVVITASTGDQGWYGWTDINSNDDPNAHSENAAYFPSTDPFVVGTGGTRLYVNTDDESRYAEYVWNDQGVADSEWINYSTNSGATGGGCSTLHAAPAWQSKTPNYADFGCDGKRSAADISAIGDPESGYSVYLEYGGDGWTTIGGTSLSSPVVAAMYALAGGANGAAYPAATLYTNAALHPASLYDIVNPVPHYDEVGGFVAGGNSWCGGAQLSDCESATDSELQVNNPNVYNSGDYLDCSFPLTGMPSTTALNPQCNATAGFDGPSGVGAPSGGLGVFARTAPALGLARPSSLRLHHPARFGAKLAESYAPHTYPARYVWTWGDGTHTTVSTSSASIVSSHVYSRPCTCTVRLTATDSRGQVVMRTTRVTVGKHASVHYHRPAKVRRHHRARFSAKGTTTPNTGAHITSVRWRWGDHHASTGTTVHHTYKKADRFRITIKVTDSTGVTTVVHHHIRVRR